ncbi:hypothetical protein RJ639_024187 [Escallonia herrerae]|uniref:Rhamnogalacturonan lyase domain-containing protein n=1 Tax=Escallonia herrerae TaxID=1293975 RepID=A0AA88V1E5_9ASTE|nr:hypothetical protein RJ639_024187 [Escallonia herrerae]
MNTVEVEGACFFTVSYPLNGSGGLATVHFNQEDLISTGAARTMVYRSKVKFTTSRMNDDTPAKGADVGLALLGYVGSWRRQCKDYQFWTKADEGVYLISPLPTSKPLPIKELYNIIDMGATGIEEESSSRKEIDLTSFIDITKYKNL